MERDPSRERAAWREAGPFERGRIDEAIARGDVLRPELLDATLHRAGQRRRQAVASAVLVPLALASVTVILWRWEPADADLDLLRVCAIIAYGLFALVWVVFPIQWWARARRTEHVNLSRYLPNEAVAPAPPILERFASLVERAGELRFRPDPTVTWSCPECGRRVHTDATFFAGFRIRPAPGELIRACELEHGVDH